jgi:hypothetical protein
LGFAGWAGDGGVDVREAHGKRCQVWGFRCQEPLEAPSPALSQVNAMQQLALAKQGWGT